MKPIATPRRFALLLTALLSLALLALTLALALGSVSLALPGLWQDLSSGQPSISSTVLTLRLERGWMAFITGGSLALAGALMQVLLRNPLADPYILGLSGGSAVGALLAILLLGAAWMIDAAAFCGALLSMTLVAGLARRDLLASDRLAEHSPRLLLTGVVLSAGWGAIVTLLLALAPDGQLRSMVFWLMGDLGGAEFRWWPSLLLALGLLWALRHARSLNVLVLGPTLATALGVNVAPLRRSLFGISAVLAATSVTTAGGIGFVGLIVPHACRLALGNDHRLLLPACVLGGGSFLLLADTLARTLLAPQQLPVGVLTAFIGVPIFLLQLAHDRRHA